MYIEARKRHTRGEASRVARRRWTFWRGWKGAIWWDWGRSEICITMIKSLYKNEVVWREWKRVEKS